MWMERTRFVLKKVSKMYLNGLNIPNNMLKHLKSKRAKKQMIALEPFLESERTFQTLLYPFIYLQRENLAHDDLNRTHGLTQNNLLP